MCRRLKGEILEEYSQFLLEGLAEVVDYFPDHSHRAHEVCKVLSIGSPIPETYFRLYTENIDIDENTFYNAVAYFSGIGELKIVCDCYEDHNLCSIFTIEQTIMFDIGVAAKIAENGDYLSICAELAGLREEVVG